MQEVIRKGCEALEKCEEMISKLGLFSANETKDDIITTNIKYIMVLASSSKLISFVNMYFMLHYKCL